MAQIEVGPLAQADAEVLAASLIKHEGLVFEKLGHAATAVANLADRFPYYIQHIVRALRSEKREAQPDVIEAAVNAKLIDPNDPWELQHYYDRIRTYYEDDATAAILILNELATTSPHASIDELLKMLKGSSPFNDRERLLALLTSMARDHYLVRSTEGKYGFKFPLIRRWWKLRRGL